MFKIISKIMESYMTLAYKSNFKPNMNISFKISISSQTDDVV